MGLPKSEFLIYEEAYKLLLKFHNKPYVNKNSIEPTDTLALDFLLKYDLVRPFIIDDYEITYMGKEIIKAGSIREFLNNAKEKERERKKNNRNRRIQSIKNVFGRVKTGINNFFNSEWVKIVGGGLIVWWITTNFDLISDYIGRAVEYLNFLF